VTVQTGGPIRGLISRWLVRFEASQQVFRLVFLGVTAASTLTSALALLGLDRYAPYLLGVGLVGSPLFAFGYVESGVYNRKNRERMDRGDNFAGPGMAMSLYTQGDQFAAGLAAALEVDERRVRAAVETATRERMAAYRDGIDVETAFCPPGTHELADPIDRREVER